MTTEELCEFNVDLVEIEIAKGVLYHRSVINVDHSHNISRRLRSGRTAVKALEKISAYGCVTRQQG